MQSLTEQQNTQLGMTAALIEGLILQPTVYWTSAKQMRMPFTINPRIIYRGTGANLCNEMGQMGFQFGMTGFIKSLWGDGMTQTQEVASAVGGGGLSAFVATPIECVMIQQQRYGGTLPGTAIRIRAELFRGLTLAIARDAIYIGGFLGVTPILQSYFERQHQMAPLTAGFCASIAGGVMGALPSHPFDVIKTCMQGDLERELYTTPSNVLRKLLTDGGVARLYSGCFWRTLNITATVFIANECMVRLPQYMFAAAHERC